jgi:hypothetical protein
VSFLVIDFHFVYFSTIVAAGWWWQIQTQQGVWLNQSEFENQTDLKEKQEDESSRPRKDECSIVRFL